MKFKMVSSLLRRLPSTVWSHTLSRLKGTLNAVQEEEVRRQCRRRKERVDSVTPEILLEREKYLERIQQFPLDREVISRLQKEGFGRKRKLPTLYTQVYSPEGSSRITNTAAGGFATFMAAATRNWPIFQHMLPEIAFAGHSNCGKSTLVNGMIGLPPNKGKASVSDRAGWTDQICFYQLGKKPPILTLVDLPGYGHAVASAFDKKQWKEMTRDYLGGSRVILSRCCVLVDCSRGICEEDRKLLRFLSKVNTPWQVILTKGDLLTAEELGQSMAAVLEDIKDFKGVVEENKVLPVSASTGAGIQSLWRELRKAAELSSKPAPLGSVKEHIKADVVKRSVNVLR